MTADSLDPPRLADTLDIWTVYKQPSDYPDQHVARRFEITPIGFRPTTDIFVATTLAELHALLPPGLVRMEREEHDDPVIVENWL
jgi:hypothetical protein